LPQWKAEVLEDLVSPGIFSETSEVMDKYIEALAARL